MSDDILDGKPFFYWVVSLYSESIKHSALLLFLASLQILTHKPVGHGTPIGERLLNPSDASAKLFIGSSVGAPFHERMQTLLSRCGHANAKERPGMEEVLQEVNAVLRQLNDVPSVEEAGTTPEPPSASNRAPVADAPAPPRRTEASNTRLEPPDLTRVNLGNTPPRRTCKRNCGVACFFGAVASTVPSAFATSTLLAVPFTAADESTLISSPVSSTHSFLELGGRI